MRPAIQRQLVLLMSIALGVLLAEFLITDDVTWRLVHQMLVVFILVSAWPQNPKRRGRQSVQIMKRIRRWSTAMPRAASLKTLRHMGSTK